MRLKNVLTTVASTFAGAFWGAVTTTPGTAFLSKATAEQALAGAVLVGAVAVYHLYQPKPVSS